MKHVFTKALKYLLVHSISGYGNATVIVKLYQSNTSRIHPSIERGEKVLHEIAQNTLLSTTVSEDCLIRAIYTSDVVKTLRDAISSIEFKGG